MEYEVEIPPQQLAVLADACEETDQSLEEVLARAIENFLNGSDENGN